jgi:hypothetical protein
MAQRSRFWGGDDTDSGSESGSTGADEVADKKVSPPARREALWPLLLHWTGSPAHLP